jgi:hypothetical protein
MELVKKELDTHFNNNISNLISSYFEREFLFVIDKDNLSIRPDINHILSGYEVNECYFILRENSLDLTIKFKNMITKFLMNHRTEEMAQIVSFPDFTKKIKIVINITDLNIIMDKFAKTSYFSNTKLFISSNGIEFYTTDKYVNYESFEIKALVID